MLAITQKIVIQQGGEILAESEPGTVQHSILHYQSGYEFKLIFKYN